MGLPRALPLHPNKILNMKLPYFIYQEMTLERNKNHPPKKILNMRIFGIHIV